LWKIPFPSRRATLPPSRHVFEGISNGVFIHIITRGTVGLQLGLPPPAIPPLLAHIDEAGSGLMFVFSRGATPRWMDIPRLAPPVKRAARQ
jgi:hypothetical protein